MRYVDDVIPHSLRYGYTKRLEVEDKNLLNTLTKVTGLNSTLAAKHVLSVPITGTRHSLQSYLQAAPLRDGLAVQLALSFYNDLQAMDEVLVNGVDGSDGSDAHRNGVDTLVVDIDDFTATGVEGYNASWAAIYSHFGLVEHVPMEKLLNLASLHAPGAAERPSHVHIASTPPELKAEATHIVADELDALIAGGRLQAIAGLVEQESKKSRERYRASAFVRNFPADLSHSGV